MRQPDDEGGRGLKIIESLATDWGTAASPSHKIVWFELATESSLV